MAKCKATHKGGRETDPFVWNGKQVSKKKILLFKKGCLNNEEGIWTRHAKPIPGLKEKL